MKINIGLNDKARKSVANHVCHMLADTYALYLKTQNFHWNVSSALFHSLHLLFESQYEELSNANDTLAERIRALGHAAPGSFSEFSKLTSIKESLNVPPAKDMLQQLLTDHELIIRHLREIFSEVQEQDEVTADLIIQRLHAHEKMAWMLRSSVE